MSGSSVFAFGSTSINNQAPMPAVGSTASLVTEWTLLGGWVTGLFFVNVTSNTPGGGGTFAQSMIGLCPIDPVTGGWADVFSPADLPVITNDGALLKISTVPYCYCTTCPLNGNAYAVVFYGNPGSLMTMSAGLIVHD